MSIWTHVNGSIRFDGYDENRIKQALGNIVTFDDILNAFRERDEDLLVSTHLPCGSEGTLNYTIWTNPKINHADRYTINIFGDLRDVDTTEGIEQWFRESIEKLDPSMIRSAILQIEVETGANLVLVFEFLGYGESFDQVIWDIKTIDMNALAQT